jgi:dolichol-phosphate mannosyltransferase
MSTLATPPITIIIPDTVTVQTKSAYPVSLGVIVPAYNEVRTIREILDRVYKALDGKFTDLQVIVVDDASTDGTSEELAKIVEDNPRIELHTHEKNRGKGAAIRTALEHLHTDLVIIQDADLEYDPNDIPSLVEPLLAGEADIIFGSRVLPLPDGKPRPRRNIYGLGVWILNCLIRVLYGYRLTDHATCYKLLKSDDLRMMNLFRDRFEFCTELIDKAKQSNLSISERPITYRGRISNEGKKIRFTDFVRIFFSLIDNRFEAGHMFRRSNNRLAVFGITICVYCIDQIPPCFPVLVRGQGNLSDVSSCTVKTPEFVSACWTEKRVHTIATTGRFTSEFAIQGVVR